MRRTEARNARSFLAPSAVVNVISDATTSAKTPTVATAVAARMSATPSAINRALAVETATGAAV